MKFNMISFFVFAQVSISLLGSCYYSPMVDGAERIEKYEDFSTRTREYVLYLREFNREERIMPAIFDTSFLGLSQLDISYEIRGLTGSRSPYLMFPHFFSVIRFPSYVLEIQYLSPELYEFSVLNYVTYSPLDFGVYSGGGSEIKTTHVEMIPKVQSIFFEDISEILNSICLAAESSLSRSYMD